MRNLTLLPRESLMTNPSFGEREESGELQLKKRGDDARTNFRANSSKTLSLSDAISRYVNIESYAILTVPGSKLRCRCFHNCQFAGTNLRSR